MAKKNKRFSFSLSLAEQERLRSAEEYVSECKGIPRSEFRKQAIMKEVERVEYNRTDRVSEEEQSPLTFKERSLVQTRMAFWSARACVEDGEWRAKHIAQLVMKEEGLKKNPSRFLSYVMQVKKMIHSAFEHYFKGLLWMNVAKKDGESPREKVRAKGHGLAKIFRALPGSVQKECEDAWAPLTHDIKMENAVGIGYLPNMDDLNDRQPMKFSEYLEYIDWDAWTIGPYFWQEPLGDPKKWFQNAAPFIEMLKFVDRVAHRELRKFVDQ